MRLIAVAPAGFRAGRPAEPVVQTSALTIATEMNRRRMATLMLLERNETARCDGEPGQERRRERRGSGSACRQDEIIAGKPVYLDRRRLWIDQPELANAVARQQPHFPAAIVGRRARRRNLNRKIRRLPRHLFRVDDVR